MAVQKNSNAVEYAPELNDKNQSLKRSEWSDAQPDASEKNGFISRNGWEDFAKWHLAVDTDANEKTKARYTFPDGDFQRVHRIGLIAARQRASTEGYNSVREAADKLLEKMPGPEAD